ncbi:MAG: type II secretion system protein [Verrucomicrobiales bacterium]
MKTTQKRKPNAFSLVELLMVLTIISIMAALIINAFSNAAKDTNSIISRQQQAVLESAVMNAISQYMVSGYTLEEGRRYYMYANSTDGTKRTMKERLALIQPYLKDEVYDHIASRSSANTVQSAAMIKTSQYVEFEDWSAATAANRNTYPKVSLKTITP